MGTTRQRNAWQGAASAAAVALDRARLGTLFVLRRLAADLVRQAETEPLGLLTRMLLGFSFLFMAVPGLDLGVASWFAAPGGGFPLQAHPGLLLVRQVNHALMLALIATAFASLFVAAVNLPSRWVMRPHKALFLLAVYAAGPGLLVNLVLKNLFGRARPRELVEFGGTLDFSTPWQLAGGCVGNCSFSSGEAASAAAMLAVALIVPKRWRIATFVALALPAALFSLNRIAFGGHFLSDVVLSWLLVGIVMLLIRAPLFAAAARIDNFVSGIGLPAWQSVGARLGHLKLSLFPAQPL